MPWNSPREISTFNSGPVYLQAQTRATGGESITVSDVFSPFFDLTIDVFRECVFTKTFNVADGGEKTVDLETIAGEDVTVLIDPVGQGTTSTVRLNR